MWVALLHPQYFYKAA